MNIPAQYRRLEGSERPSAPGARLVGPLEPAQRIITYCGLASPPRSDSLLYTAIWPSTMRPGRSGILL
jgi:hypothetical protein